MKSLPNPLCFLLISLMALAARAHAGAGAAQATAAARAIGNAPAGGATENGQEKEGGLGEFTPPTLLESRPIRFPGLWPEGERQFALAPELRTAASHIGRSRLPRATASSGVDHNV